MGMDEVMQKEQGGEQEKSEAEARGRHEGLGGVERSPRGSARAGGGPTGSWGRRLAVEAPERGQERAARLPSLPHQT